MADARNSQNEQVIDAEIHALVQQVREHQNAIEDEEQAIQRIKARLVELLEARGANWSDDYGYARLAQEGRRIHYDTQALDELIITDPLRYGWLRDYRRETTVPSRVLIR